ncbi:hypothetical protein K8354_04290 [Polaribacter litorisediminis]|uniref:DUF6090 family protein n=1 Tax=Polaribacter litorisediminis TaxID=1908341 RepID=UPI001CBFCBBB|nr:DUF6090 family protein [Polaribacter litorisediminis]UAM99049.1 hypothetical protein K8354_04290 [Polaribacter litorisediminis]
MENKTGKYFKYAIGEIVLVVIGILIALSINNWNEERKINLKEKSLFKNIVVDLAQEEKILNEALTNYKYNSDSYEHIYNETIGKASYDSTNTVYNSLRWHNVYDLIVTNKHASAISEINNDNIIDLLNLKIRIEVVNSQAKNRFNNFKDEIIPDFFSRHGLHDNKVLFNLEKNKWSPIVNTNIVNYDRLKLQYGSIEFDQILATLRLYTTWAIYNLEKLIKLNKEISVTLNEELLK